MGTYIRHLRPINLFLLLLIQTWLYVYIGYHYGFDFGLPIPVFVSLVLLLIGASGYIINDFYDIATDKANQRASSLQIERPDRLLKYFWAIAVAGFGIATMVAWRLKNFQWLILHPVSLVGLWYYSIRLKCTPLIGNLWVSMFASSVFILPFLTIYLMTGNWYVDVTIKLFILSSFLSTFYREVVKDLEDVAGDEVAGCNTLPVKFGSGKAKSVGILVAFLELITLVIWIVASQKVLFQMGLSLILLVYIYTIILLFKAFESMHYRWISSILKVIMYAGALLLMLS